MSRCLGYINPFETCCRIPSCQTSGNIKKLCHSLPSYLKNCPSFPVSLTLTHVFFINILPTNLSIKITIHINELRNHTDYNIQGLIVNLQIAPLSIQNGWLLSCFHILNVCSWMPLQNILQPKSIPQKAWHFSFLRSLTVAFYLSSGSHSRNKE